MLRLLCVVARSRGRARGERVVASGIIGRKAGRANGRPILDVRGAGPYDHGHRSARSPPTEPARGPEALDMARYRSHRTTLGRTQTAARDLWRATGTGEGDLTKPIVAIANSYTRFVPGHVHLKPLGELVAEEVHKAGAVAKEFHTIAVDDGIAMGHEGMLYSLPSRELIADAVEYMVKAHCAEALVCMSKCV